MPNVEDIRRKAQNAAYNAAEKAQEAAAAASEKAEKLTDYAAERAGTIKSAAGEKAGALLNFAGEKVGAIRDAAVTGVSLMSEKRRLERNYQVLGEWYAAQCADNAPEAVADVVRAIRASQEKIAELRSRGESEEDAGEGEE